MYVYLINELATDNYKIGVSIHPEKRVKQLQTANRLPLVLTAVIETLDRKGALAIEKRLHAVYDGCRASGEWFLIRDLDSIAQVYDVTFVCDQNQ